MPCKYKLRYKVGQQFKIDEEVHSTLLSPKTYTLTLHRNGLVRLDRTRKSRLPSYWGDGVLVANPHNITRKEFIRICKGYTFINVKT